MPPARAVLYAATIGGFAFVGRALLRGPPPLDVASLLLAGYLLLVLAGVLRLKWRMFADAIVCGPPDARGFVLTFDDGPDPSTTPSVLEELERAGARATFFMIGRKAEAYPELVRDVARRGHVIGLHAYDHDRLFALRSALQVRRNLERGIRVLEGLTGRKPKFFRPPIGHTNPSIVRVAEELDLTIIGWSVSGRDGVAAAKPARVLARVRHALRDGAIVLLHDAAERGGRVPAGVKALPEILKAASASRLPVVPLASWVRQGEDAGD